MKSERLPDLFLERFALGELPPEQHAAIAARLDAEPELAARLAALQASNAAVLEAIPAADVAAEVERRQRAGRTAAEARDRSPRRPWIGVGVFVAAAAAAVLFVVIPRGGEPRQGVPSNPGKIGPVEDRAKGDPRLLLHVKRDGNVVELDQGATVRAGDLVQLSYIAAEATHGAILSIDGGGAVSLHFPEQPGGSTALQGGGTVGLPHSYELDDAPHFERFFFISSSHPIDVSDLLERATSLADRPAEARRMQLPVPEGLAQVSRLLLKESSR